MRALIPLIIKVRSTLIKKLLKGKLIKFLIVLVIFVYFLFQGIDEQKKEKRKDALDLWTAVHEFFGARVAMFLLRKYLLSVQRELYIIPSPSSFFF